MAQRISQALDKLGKLQNSDGSWSWWPGMRGSVYMTTAVSEMLVRLNQMTGHQDETERCSTTPSRSWARTSWNWSRR